MIRRSTQEIKNIMSLCRKSQCILFTLVEFSDTSTVNPLSNDIRYNSKARYNVNLVCAKISVYFFIGIPILFFRKAHVLCIC